MLGTSLLLLSALSLLASAQVPCYGPPPRCSGDLNPGIPTDRHRCAYKGTLTTPTPQDEAPVQVCDNNGCYGNCTATSYAQCRDLCLSSNQGCKSFGYNIATGLCTTSTKIPQSQGYVYEASSTVYYTNSACFTNVTFYEGDSNSNRDGFHFIGESGTGASVNASQTDVQGDPGAPIQPYLSKNFKYKLSNACDAAAACVAYVDTHGTGNTVLNVEYNVTAKQWMCQAFTSEETLIQLEYTPNKNIAGYYSYSTGFQR